MKSMEVDGLTENQSKCEIDGLTENQIQWKEDTIRHLKTKKAEVTG